MEKSLKLIGVFQDITEFAKSQIKFKQQIYSDKDADHHSIKDKLDEIEKELMENNIKAGKVNSAIIV